MNLLKKGIAEAIGTMILVLFGCGVAIFASGKSYYGTVIVNGTEFIVATSLAFGLAIVAGAYSIGNISGCHVNPAVSLAMAINKKITWVEFAVYVFSQLVGATVACLILYMAFGKDSGFGANQIQNTLTEGADKVTFGMMTKAFVIELVLTFVFVLTVLGVTSKKKNAAVAGIVIGLTLTLVHLLGLAFTGTSVNPARSIIPALFAGGDALKQVWIFILAPFAGGALAGVASILFGFNKETE